MSELHQVGVMVENKADLEKVDLKFIADGLIKARDKTIEVLKVISAELKEGQSENEARMIAQNIFSDYGVAKHWHRPYIRFGAGTSLTFNDPLSENLLQTNSPYYLDLGPVWPSEKLGVDSNLEYEGDYGDSFVFGQNTEAQKMIETLHDAFHATKQQWKTNKFTGEDIYKFCRELIEEKGYVFVEEVAGHRVSDFPHKKYSKDRLSKVTFVPSSSLWILEAMVRHPTLNMGAFYEDLMI